MDDELPTHPRLEEVNLKICRESAYPSVDSNYRVLGCGNVYATGSALFPTTGSWNPTLTMCGYAQDLATKLHNNDIFREVFSMSIASSLANHLTKSLVPEKPLAEFLADQVKACLPVVPTTTLEIQVDWSVVWGPAIWQQYPESDNDGIDLAWYAAYHPLVKYEDGTLHPTYVIAISAGRRDVIDRVTNFDDWVKAGLRSRPEGRMLNGKPDHDGRWVSFAIADLAYRLLNTRAEADSGDFLDFIKNKAASCPSDSSTRFIFTGHGVGGSVAVTLALALVGDNNNNGILFKFQNTKDVLTYPTGAPSPGNTAFTDLFEETFPARRLDNLYSYKSWNLNLVNLNDAVPQAWCTDKRLSPKQNLYNILNLIALPMEKVLKAVGSMLYKSKQSQVVYMPLPSQYFICTHNFNEDEPRTDNGLKRLVFQHLQAYYEEVAINIHPWSVQQKIFPASLEVIYDLAYLSPPHEQRVNTLFSEGECSVMRTE